MSKMAVREKLQIDTKPETRFALRALAAAEGMTLRQFILKTIARQYPEFTKHVESEFNTN
jgi:uncharacterized protein (DUF1778 family)